MTVSIVFDPRDRAAGARSLAAPPLPLRAVGFTVSSPASSVVEFPKSNFAFFSAALSKSFLFTEVGAAVSSACLESDAVASLESGMGPQSSDKGP